jgi:hypothetical protein
VPPFVVCVTSVLCHNLNLYSEAIVFIDGSKFKTVNYRDKNFPGRKLQARMEQFEESIARNTWPTRMPVPWRQAAAALA